MGLQRAPFRWDSWNLFDAQAPEKLEADKARTPLRTGGPTISAPRTPAAGVCAACIASHPVGVGFASQINTRSMLWVVSPWWPVWCGVHVPQRS